jgi:hypothetical protein
MDTFQENRVVIQEQPFQQLTIRPGTYDIGQLIGKALVTFMAFVIVYLYTIVIEYGLLTPSVFKTVQMNLYTCGMQQTDLMKKIEYSPVIYRVGHVQAHDM